MDNQERFIGVFNALDKALYAAYEMDMFSVYRGRVDVEDLPRLQWWKDMNYKWQAFEGDKLKYTIIEWPVDKRYFDYGDIRAFIADSNPPPIDELYEYKDFYVD
jgi:hypothetical protein